MPVARCEGCYCEVPDDRRRCLECGLVLWHSIASGVVYALTYVGVIGMLVAGSYLGVGAIAMIGGYAFVRTRRRVRELRAAAQSGTLPRALLLRE